MQRRSHGNPVGLTLRPLDVLDVEVVPDGEHIRPASVSASVLCSPGDGGTGIPITVCNSLYVYLVENEAKVVEVLKANAGKCPSKGGGCDHHQKAIKHVFSTDVWCLPHSHHVIAANWNRDTASKINKLLVTVAEDMIACIWRIGPSSFYEILLHIDIGETSFGKAVQPCWIEMPLEVPGTLLDGKCYILFYENVPLASAPEEDRNQSNSSDGAANAAKDHKRDSDEKTLSCHGEANASTQIFKVFYVDGIQTASNSVTVECVLSNKDIEIPMPIKRVTAARVSPHTLETGLVTLYTSDTVRPTKVCAKGNFQVSRWITTISASVKSEVSKECHDELIGKHFIMGMNKVLPPFFIHGKNDIGLDVNIFITPCDVFLKDMDVSSGDNVIGLVVRYVGYAKAPFFAKTSLPEEGLTMYQTVEDSILERYRSRKDVAVVESFYDDECFAVFVLYRTGKMEVLRTFTNNSGFCSTKEFRIKNIAHIKAMKVLRHGNRILFMMFVVNNKGAFLCSIYEWNTASVSHVASWPFRPAERGEKLIINFDLWYEGGPFYLITQCFLADGYDANKEGNTNVYLIDGTEIRHWLSLSLSRISEFIDDVKFRLGESVVDVAYSLKEDKLVCKSGGEEVEIPLLGADEESFDEMPLYHPKYIRSFLDLGLRRFVDEIIFKLVEVYREVLAKLAETDTCSAGNSLYGGCDCLIIKAKHLELFSDFSRSFSYYLLKTFAELIGHDPARLFADDFCAHVERVNLNDGLPLNELILYLQHVRLPGIIWREQIDLMDILQTLQLREGSKGFVLNRVTKAKTSYGLDKASNFMLLSEPKGSREYEMDETIDVKLSLADDTTEENCELRSSVSCPLIVRVSSLLNRGKEEEPLMVDRTNDRLSSLTVQNKIMTDDFCLGRYLDYIKYDFGDEEYVVWAMLYKDDVNLFSSVLSMIDTGDDMLLCDRLLSNMKSLGLGYWINSATCLDQLCSTLEKGFRKLIATTESGGNVEVFDEFGFWSILRNKPLVYGCVLKAKGFQRLGEFLSNNFTEDHWKQVAIKNAYALIGKKRYLLASGFLVLAGRLDDAVDVCFQYLKDPQLACIICKIRQHDLGYTINLMKPSRIRDILCSKLGMSCVVPVAVDTVESLVYYLYTGYRYQYVTEEVMIETTKKCAKKYRNMGMPLVTIMLNLLIESAPDRWSDLVARSTVKLVLGQRKDECNVELHEYMQILLSLCEESIKKNLSDLSNYGSDITIEKVPSAMEMLSDPDMNRTFLGLDSFCNADELTASRNLDLGFHIHMVNVICSLKKRFGLYISIGFGTQGVSFSRHLFEKVSRMSNYFSQLCRCCIAFLEEGVPIDGNMMLVLTLRAVIDGRNDLPSCLILSISSLLTLVCFNRGVVGQVYDAILGQVIVLNNLLNNQGSGERFLACLFRALEPLCFGAPGHTVYPDSLNVLNFIDNAQKHAFFGICLGTALLEMLTTLCRTWLCNFAENADPETLKWMDGIIIASSRFIYFNMKNKVLDDALNYTGIVFPMLSLRVRLETPVDVKAHNEECHVYDSFLENYVASVYGTSFEKLWRFLHCGFHTSNLFSSPPQLKDSIANDIFSSEFYLQREGKIEQLTGKALPFIMPLSCLLSDTQTWNAEYVAAQDTLRRTDNFETKNTSGVSMAVLEAISTRFFKASRMFKGRMLSTLHSLPSMTNYDSIISLTNRTILEPFLNDLYLMVRLNVEGSSKLSMLSHGFSRAIVDEIYASVVSKTNITSVYAIYVKLIKAISTYCKSHLGKVYKIKHHSKITRLAAKLFKRFRLCTDTKEHPTGGLSGGICGHPTLPVYAVVYGENQTDRLPAYTVSLEHSAVLAKESIDAARNEDINYTGRLIYDSMSGTPINTGQGSVFGDLCSVGWTDDSLAVFDKNGWLLIYYLKNLNYVSMYENELAVPSISFKAHSKGTAAKWVSDTYVITVGNGVAPESIHQKVTIVDTNYDELTTKKSISLSKVPSAMQTDYLDSMLPPKSEHEHIIRGVSELNTSCICIWDLVDYGKSGAPKLKTLFANSSSVPHSIFNKKKTSSTTRFTWLLCITPLSLTNRRDAPPGNDVIIFDSNGMMMLFSWAAQEITWSYKAQQCAIIKAFYLRDKIITLGHDGTLVVLTLNGIYAEPTRVFEGMARKAASSEDSGSSSNLVSSITEYLGIPFVDNPSKETVAPSTSALPEILDAQIVQEQFLVLTTADGVVNVTELPC